MPTSPHLASATALGFLVMFAAGCSAASHHAQNQHAQTYNVGDSIGRTPISFDPSGRPTADIVLNGHHVFEFALDTAAQLTVIGPDVLDELELTPDPDQRAQVHGVTGVEMRPMYRLRSVEFAGRQIGEGVFMSPSEHDGADHGHQGLIGQDIFADGRMVLNFEDRYVMFDDVADIDLGEPIPVEFMLSGFGWISIVIDGVQVDALIDTGASESIANLSAMQALGLQAGNLIEVDERSGITNHAMTRYRGYSANVQIAGQNVDGLDLQFANARTFATFNRSDRPAIILGMDALGRLPGFVLDYDARTFQLVQ